MYNQRPEMSKKKKIEITCLIIFLLWLILLMINYYRYTDRKPLILAINKTIEYTDGIVKEYTSLGYTYRSYRREAITKEEFVPFWKFRDETPAKNTLPDTYKDYEVPRNPMREDKYKSLLYFYNRAELIGTYKCINSTRDCQKAFGGHDEYDIINKDPLTEREPLTMEFIYNQFAFVDDSFNQSAKYGDNNYERIIYLLDVVNNEIIGRYKDVKESGLDDFEEHATGDNYKYIVKDWDTEKWGIVKINESGTQEQVLPYEYDSINYDRDTKYYILKKDNEWFIYDLRYEKEISIKISDVIYDVWRNSNNTYYYKTGLQRTVGADTFIEYKIYRVDGNPLLTNSDIVEIMPTEDFVMYVTRLDKKLIFMDYSKERKKEIQLYFTNLRYDDFTHPAFKIDSFRNNFMQLYVYKGRELKDGYEIHSISTIYWD